MIPFNNGKLTRRDRTTSQLLAWAPWLALGAASLPLPLVFLILFLTSTATDSAAVYILLMVTSLGLGFLVGLLAMLVLFIYRKSWLRKLRDRLAADGITANEVTWFMSELTTAERKSLKEIQAANPLLADAYLETLAARLTAARIVARANRELIKVERRINRARSIVGADTETLIRDLEADGEQFKHLKQEATGRLAESKARLQAIEAAASRSMNQQETALMLSRLSAAQAQLPLVMEMAKLEREALEDHESELQTEVWRQD